MAMRFWLTAILMLGPLAGQVTQSLDLSTKSARAARKKYYVIFAARGGSATGHAFVLWGVEDDVHRRSTIRAYGLYPANSHDACNSVYRKVAGAVVDESTNHGITNITEELIVKVDRADFERARAVERVWDCRHEFAILDRDCVEFLRAVGAALNLDIPTRTPARWTPRAYVRALMARRFLLRSHRG